MVEQGKNKQKSRQEGQKQEEQGRFGRWLSKERTKRRDTGRRNKECKKNKDLVKRKAGTITSTTRTATKITKNDQEKRRSEGQKEDQAAWAYIEQ